MISLTLKNKDNFSTLHILLLELMIKIIKCYVYYTEESSVKVTCINICIYTFLTSFRILCYVFYCLDPELKSIS